MNDTGKVRQALKDAGFLSTGRIFNDKGKTSRRLKIYNGYQIKCATKAKRLRLVSNLQDQFGANLLHVGPYIQPDCVYNMTSVIIRVAC